MGRYCDVLHSMETKPAALTDDLDSVAVIGTGNFGRALASKVRAAGLEVVVGSRRPGPGLVPLERAFAERVVVLAVPVFSWSDLPLHCLQPGAVVVDCSNRTSRARPGQPAQAEQLLPLLPPGVALVKALNTVSAYSLENPGLFSIAAVPVAGSSTAARRTVAAILQRCGFTVQDLGGMEHAVTIENIPLSLFPAWTRPALISLLIWTFFYILNFCRNCLCQENQLGWYPTRLPQLFTIFVNKVSGAM